MNPADMLSVTTEDRIPVIVDPAKVVKSSGRQHMVTSGETQEKGMCIKHFLSIPLCLSINIPLFFRS